MPVPHEAGAAVLRPFAKFINGGLITAILLALLILPLLYLTSIGRTRITWRVRRMTDVRSGPEPWSATPEVVCIGQSSKGRARITPWPRVGIAGSVVSP